MDPNNSINPNNLTSGASPVPTSLPASPNPAPTFQTTPPPPPPSQPKVIISSGTHRNAFLLGILAVFLLVGLGAGVYLVRQQQDIRSKATGTCDMRWMADPGTACGQSTQSPKQGETITNLTPNFHWDYGGYRPEDNGQCVQPSGCSSYSAIVYLAEGSTYSESAIVASCGLGTSSTPPKDAPFSCFRTWRDGPQLTSLKANTSYSWVVTPFFDGVVHAEQTWKYNFKTSTPTPTTPDCTSLTTTADLNNLQVGTEYSFQLTAGGIAPVTSVEMSVYGSSCSNELRASAPQTVSGPGTYTIKWTPTQAGSFTAYGRVWNDGVAECRSDCVDAPPRYLCAGAQACKLTGTVKAASTPTAACQMVSADKDLTKIKIGDTVVFSGWGVVSSDTEKIDKINFIVTQGGAKLSDTTVDATRDTTKDSGTNKAWKGMQTFKVTDPGAYSVRIRVHWQSADKWFE